jgi:hypothetical protein
VKGLNIGLILAIGLAVLAMSLGKRFDFASFSPIHASTTQFVVSNPEDAGPGTLRDAIFAADRLSTHALIVIKVKRIAVDSALPALVNPRGVTIDGNGDGVLDAASQVSGAVLQISSPRSIIRDLRIVNAHDVALLVTAAGVQIESVRVSQSKVGISIAAAGKGCIIRSSAFDDAETGITAETGVRDVSILDTSFRRNIKAGFWYVGAPEKQAALTGPQAATDPTSVKESVRLLRDTFEDDAIGIVLANRPTLVQKSKFLRNRQSAILILGGAARIEESEFRATGGAALSVTSGDSVLIAHNTFADNANIAIMVRNSLVTIDSNQLLNNGFGIVAIANEGPQYATIRDNVVNKCTSDAITVVGGSPLLQRNHVTDNRVAGLRVLDLAIEHGAVKATPRLDGNIIKNNGIDVPATGKYQLAANVSPR